MNFYFLLEILEGAIGKRKPFEWNDSYFIWFECYHFGNLFILFYFV